MRSLDLNPLRAAGGVPLKRNQKFIIRGQGFGFILHKMGKETKFHRITFTYDIKLQREVRNTGKNRYEGVPFDRVDALS